MTPEPQAAGATARQIPIANLYHLLCYAWDFFQLDAQVDVDRDDHAGYAELLTKVLTAGCVHLLKQGLHRDYQARTEAMRAIRGKLEMAPSLSTGRLEQGVAVCTHDEFTADIPANQVLKAVLLRMARLPGMDKGLADGARAVALRMAEVSWVEPSLALLGRVRIHRNNRFYGFLLSICRLILEATSVKELREGPEPAARQQFYRAVEQRLPDLFEAFVRNFYAKHLAHQGWTHTSRRHIDWQWEALTPGGDAFLPKMETDITLEHPDCKIILDTKFYGSGGVDGDREKFHSANMYQLHAYVTQTALAASRPSAHPHDHDASGMLLYATVNDQDFHHRYQMGPHAMAVATVNLGLPWRAVEARLLAVINDVKG